MKRTRLFFLGLSLLVSAGSQAQTIRLKSSIKQVDTSHYYMKHSYDVLKYWLNVDLYHCYQSPYSTEFSAIEVITFKVDSALNSIRLNAVNSSLHIDSVGLNAISFLHANDTLNIRLDRTYQTGSLVNVKIFYRHQKISDHAVYSDGASFLLIIRRKAHVNGSPAGTVLLIKPFLT